MTEVLPATQSVHRSVWLPIGRANFYSYTANNWLRQSSAGSSKTSSGWSDEIKSDEYTPLLQVSVLRRLLEVLPRSFGYEPTGICELSEDEGDGLQRPIAVTMKVRPATALPEEDCLRRRANLLLVDARVAEVSVRVDEDGFYAFHADSRGNAEDVAVALDAHVREVFGGAFSLLWQMDPAVRQTPASLAAAMRGGYAQTVTRVHGAPARVYNGLMAGAGDSDQPGEQATGRAHQPLGILTFFQLNTLFEGLFNDALTPAVFFERDEFMLDYLNSVERAEQKAKSNADWDIGSGPIRATTGVRSAADVVGLLATDLDARSRAGKAVTLRHFLAVTSRESLHKLKWSVESVRRGLLDEMMGILHRHSRLVQLRLDKLDKDDRTPELAVDANESQLRGYDMLAGAKSPLIANVYRFAKLAARSIDPVAEERPEPDGVQPAPLGNQATNRRRRALQDGDLEYRLREWRGLLDAINANVKGLEKSVEHAWMERLLYEQEQARAEQEAMAEIERTRSSRPGAAGGTAGGTYNALMLLFTIAAAEAAIVSLAQVGEEAGLWERALSLWPLAIATVILSMFPIAGRLARYAREIGGGSERLGYEFSFSLDRRVSPQAIEAARAYEDKAHRRLAKAMEAEDHEAARKVKLLHKLALDRRGGIRIEYISADSTLVKVHSVVRFRTRKHGRWFNPSVWVPRTARFEVINEFLARTVSGAAQYVLRESRMFGDTPRALTPAQVRDLVTFVLNRTALELQEDEGRRPAITADKVLHYANPVLNGLTPAATSAVQNGADKGGGTAVGAQQPPRVPVQPGRSARVKLAPPNSVVGEA